MIDRGIGERDGAIERPRASVLSDGPCDACRRQPLRIPSALPHARLMILSSAPVVEVYGGGVETRYLCLDCGHMAIHSTGRFGKGWH